MVCPSTTEEVLQCAVVGRELVLLELVIRNDASLAQLSLLIQCSLKRIGVLALRRCCSCGCRNKLFIFMGAGLELLALSLVKVNGLEVRPIVALPLILERTLLAPESCAVITQTGNSAAAFAVPVELGPDGIECACLEHQELLVAAILPGHTPKDAGMEIDTHADAAVQKVGGKRGVGCEGHDGGIVVTGVRVRGPSLGEGVLLR